MKQGTCDFCGEELPTTELTEIKGDHYCADCRPDDTDEDEDSICSSCNGSGEGMHDGTRCLSCGGTGNDLKDDSDPFEDDR